jgi:hypothetical protein
MLWAYRNTSKKLTGKTPFILVYFQEVGVHMEFIVPSLCIVALVELTYSGAMEKRLSELVELEEDQFVVGFHQQVQKAHKKSWHDRNIKQKNFQT